MTKDGRALVRYDAMCQAIDRAYEVDEVKTIHDKAVALELYFRQAKNPEPERRACEIRLRAERKAGQLLAAMEKSKGGAQHHRKNNSSDRSTSSEYGKTLEENKITRDTAARWQQLAEVPEEDFEAALAGPEKPSTNAILEAKRPKTEPMDKRALWLWGRLLDFERDGVLDADPDYLLSQMVDHMRASTLRLAPKVRDWLGGLIDDKRRKDTE